jgi:hypothetical protein
MADLVFFLIIGIFLALLFLNIYFRVKVLKIYKVLVQNKIEFDSTHIFNSKKMEREVLTKYPKFTREILGFTSHIKKSILIAIILIALITIMGFIINNL